MMTIDEHHKWADEQMRLYGFYAHFIIDDDLTKRHPFLVNYHTHGILESFQHRDFQIAVRVRPQIALGIFHRIVDQIKAGKKYDVNTDYDDIANYACRFILAEEGERAVMRLIIPDTNGDLNPETMHPDYAKQYLYTEAT